jgi:hypothetical protein
MKDIARIIEAMSEEEAQKNPTATRYVKDIILTNLWPAVIKDFYPEAYTLGDALKEVHLLEFYQYVWSRQWIMQVFDFLDLLGIDETVLQQLKDYLSQQLERIFKYILS